MATTTKNGRYHATITSKFIHFIDNAINRSQWALQLCVPPSVSVCVCLPCTTATVCGLLCVSVCAAVCGNFFVAYFGLAHIFHVCIFHFNFISSRYTRPPLALCVCVCASVGVCVFTCTVKYAMKINKNAHPAQHTPTHTRTHWHTKCT